MDISDTCNSFARERVNFKKNQVRRLTQTILYCRMREWLGMIDRVIKPKHKVLDKFGGYNG